MIALFYAPLPEERTQHRNATQQLLTQAVIQTVPHLTSLPEIQRTELGKPYFPHCPDLHFNLSHSGQWAVCALSHLPVGVDLQQARPLRANIARNFTQAEQDFLSQQSTERFFDLWVKKEAYLKATGVGLTQRLRSFSVLPLEANCPASGYFDALLPFPVAGYHLALCGQVPIPEDLTPILLKGSSL